MAWVDRNEVVGVLRFPPGLVGVIMHGASVLFHWASPIAPGISEELLDTPMGEVITPGPRGMDRTGAYKSANALCVPYRHSQVQASSRAWKDIKQRFVPVLELDTTMQTSSAWLRTVITFDVAR